MRRVWCTGNRRLGILQRQRAPSIHPMTATPTIRRSLFTQPQMVSRSSLSVRSLSSAGAAAAAAASQSGAAAAVKPTTETAATVESSRSELAALFKMREPVRLHAVSPRRSVPDTIAVPPYIKGMAIPPSSGPVEIKSESDIKEMRAACVLASKARAYAGTLISVGRTTDDIDRAVHSFIISHGGYPSPLGYRNFPKSICTSVNEVVCHGIPDSRPLRDGDIINVDVSVYKNGWHGDCNATFTVGTGVDSISKTLIAETKTAMDLAIAACAPGVPLNRIGHIISEHAEKFQFGVVESYAGHGIGRHFHMSPIVPHFRTFDRARMAKGWVFTIEPMITEGSQANYMLEDGWTIVTRDGKRSAQFEETIAITETGVEILTQH